MIVTDRPDSYGSLPIESGAPNPIKGGKEAYYIMRNLLKLLALIIIYLIIEKLKE